MALLAYTLDELRALNRHDVRPARPVRKSIFRLRLWQPAHQRSHSRHRLLAAPGTRPFRTRSAAVIDGLSLGCINARSVGNKAATLCRTIVDEQLDVLVITETWHECSESTELQRVTPANYKCIDAARPLPPDANVDTLTFHNHGGLAFIYRQSLKLQKRNVDATVTTFEFLCGFASTASCHFILLGVYRPGSQALSTTFFDDLSAVFDQLATYQCPVVVCGDFNVHVDAHDDVYAQRLTQLLQC